MRTSTAFAAMLALACASRTAAADPAPSVAEENQVTWHEDWPRFHVVEYISTGILGAATIYLLIYSPEAPYWKGPNRVDDAIREQLRAHTDTGRMLAGRISDVLALALIAQPLAIDPIVTWAGRGSGDVAYQTTAINIETMVTNLFVHTIFADVAGRERPFGRLCVGEKKDSPECKAGGRYRSFFSGHTTMSFTGASLVCTTHIHEPIYGKPGDAIACGAALGAAATVGTMRIVADKHYATDVLLGATTGMIVGFGMPWVLHYRGGAASATGPKGGSGAPPVGGTLAWKF